MDMLLLRLYVKFQNLLHRDEGQDIVEYSLLAGLIALGATAVISGIGNGIGSILNRLTAIFAAA